MAILSEGGRDKLKNLFWGLLRAAPRDKLRFIYTSIRHTLKYSLMPGLAPRDIELTLGGGRFRAREFTGEIGMFNQVYVERMYVSHPAFKVLDCKRGGVVMDVGANIGMYTVQIARLNPGCRVMSFEPNPDVYERLLANVGLNRLENVSSFMLGFSDKAGPAYMDDSAATVLGSVKLAGGEGMKAIELDTLDSFISRTGIDEVELLKVDVEGFELEALRGCSGSLNKIRKIVLECATHLEPGVTALLEAAGFEKVLSLPRNNVLYFVNRKLA